MGEFYHLLLLVQLFPRHVPSTVTLQAPTSLSGCIVTCMVHTCSCVGISEFPYYFQTDAFLRLEGHTCGVGLLTPKRMHHCLDANSSHWSRLHHKPTVSPGHIDFSTFFDLEMSLDTWLLFLDFILIGPSSHPLLFIEHDLQLLPCFNLPSRWTNFWHPGNDTMSTGKYNLW